MALLRKFLRLLKPEPDESGTGTGVVDRGDIIPEDEDLDPDQPDAVKAAEAAAAAAAEAALAAELKAEGDTESDTKTPRKDARIPLSRHEAVLAKEREKRADVERQLAQFQSGKAAEAATADIAALETSVQAMEKEYSTLLADGQVDKAIALMTKIRTTERQMSAALTSAEVRAVEVRAVEQVRYSTALERIEASYPQLNEDHEEFNAELLGDVADLKEVYQTRGMTPTQALQKAVQLLVPTTTAAQTAATTVTPRATAPSAADTRKTDAVKKAVDAVEKTPPILTKVGLDGNKLGGGALDAKAVMGMSQKEFAKLNEADLARMRGDTL